MKLIMLLAYLFYVHLINLMDNKLARGEFAKTGIGMTCFCPQPSRRNPSYLKCPFFQDNLRPRNFKYHRLSSLFRAFPFLL